MGNESNQQEAAAQAADDGTVKAAESEFAPTQIEERAENLNALWSESTDGQCSESAALFAASQPAPLSVV